MADTWGGSWGDAWGGSWGSDSVSADGAGRRTSARRLPKPVTRPPLRLPWADDERPVKTALERPDPSEPAALPAARIEPAPSVAAAVAATNVVDAMDDDLPYVAAMILLLDEDDDDNTLQA